MNLNKNLLLIGAIIGIGLFALPSTLSMFAGQHSWYDPNTQSIPCTKCHEKEYQELANGGPHSPGYSVYNTTADYGSGVGVNGSVNYWGGAGAPIGDRCYGCHQVGYNPDGNAVFDNNTKHAAVSIGCVECHSWVPTELMDASEGHAPFYNVDDTELLAGKNEVCLGCHTMVGVNITWIRATHLTFTVDNDAAGTTVTWNGTDDGIGSDTSRVTGTPYGG